jgi:hypothetical protein
VKDPQDYPWSSHRDYLVGKEDLVDTKRVLGLFSEKVYQARKKYRDFIDRSLGEGKNESFYRALGQQILGNDEFVKEVEKKAVRLDRPIRKPSLKEITKAVQEVTGISLEGMVSHARNKEALLARKTLVGVWREYGYKLVHLQSTMKRDLSVLSRSSNQSAHDDVRRAVEEVVSILNARMQA